MDEESEKRRQNFVAKFNLPSSEILLGAFTAALSKQILLHGRLYISHNYFCFYSNVFAIKTFVRSFFLKRNATNLLNKILGSN